MEQEMNKKEIRKRRLWRALMFYGILLVAVLGVLLVLRSAMKPLGSWLEQYQTASAKKTEEDIFGLLFADPDWAMLYDMAGMEDTKFEGKGEFAAYMEAQIGEDPLTYAEIPTGLADHRHFSLRHEGREIGYFTMVPKGTDDFQITQWTLGEIDLYFERTETVTVILPPDCTVYINRVALDDTYTTLSVYTLAESYLEEELHGYRYQQQTVTGLLVQPEVIVLDAYGRPMELTQDPDMFPLSQMRSTSLLSVP